MLPILLLPLFLAVIHAAPATHRLGRSRMRAYSLPAPPTHQHHAGRLAGSRTTQRELASPTVPEIPDSGEVWELADTPRAQGSVFVTQVGEGREEMLSKAWTELISPSDENAGQRAWFEDEYVGDLEGEDEWDWDMGTDEALQVEEEGEEEEGGQWWRHFGLSWEDTPATAQHALASTWQSVRGRLVAQQPVGIASRPGGGWDVNPAGEWYLVDLVEL